MDESGGASAGDEVSPRGRSKFLYLWLGWTPPAEYAEWVRRDIQSRAWLIRQVISTALALLLGAFVAGLIVDGPNVGLLLGAGIGVSVLTCLDLTVLSARRRRRMLAYYEKRWKRRARPTRSPST